MKTAAAARQQQGRVLVVEDERDVADLIRYNLTKEGYDVVVAPTGSAAPRDPDKQPHAHLGELETDRSRFEVRMKGPPVAPTPKEFELLAPLAGAPGRVFGREELLDAVWGRAGFLEPRPVDVHVARLRAKFTAAKLPAPGLETVPGVGYRFREPARS